MFPDLSLQKFLDLYFWLIGSIAVAGNITPPLRQWVRPLPFCCCLPAFDIIQEAYLHGSADSGLTAHNHAAHKSSRAACCTYLRWQEEDMRGLFLRRYQQHAYLQRVDAPSYETL